MKRTAKPTPQIKKELVTIDDDEPVSSEQPNVKIVKKEVQPSVQPTSALTVAEVQKKLKKSEEKCQRAINIAGQHLARVEFLESLIDKKPNVSQEAKVEEMERKMIELSNELEAERQRGNEDRKRNDELTAYLNRQLDELRRHNEGLAVQYQSAVEGELAMRRQVQINVIEQRRALEIQLQDRARIVQVEIEMLKLKEDLANSRINHEKDRKLITELSSQLTLWASQGVQPQKTSARGPQDPRLKKLQPASQRTSQVVQSPASPEKDPVQPQQPSVSGPQDPRLKTHQRPAETGAVDPSVIWLD